MCSFNEEVNLPAEVRPDEVMLLVGGEAAMSSLCADKVCNSRLGL